MVLTMRGLRATLAVIVSLAKPQTDVSTRPGGGLPTQDELPYSDGDKLESERHVLAMMLLISSLKPWLSRRYRDTGEGGYVGGDMFLYFSPEQVKNRHFRGPDVLVALGVEPGERKSWVAWQEGKGPDVVIELLSESTQKTDKKIKPGVYRDEAGVREYFWFDPFNPEDFAGFAFWSAEPASPDSSSACPEPNLAPDDQGRITSEILGLRLGTWKGRYEGVEAVWLRWYTPAGELLLTEEAELADEADRRADEADRRAGEADKRADEEARRAEVLASKLRELGIDPDQLS